jgi:hypothetical protein
MNKLFVTFVIIWILVILDGGKFLWLNMLNSDMYEKIASLNFVQHYFPMEGNLWPKLELLLGVVGLTGTVMLHHDACSREEDA